MGKHIEVLAATIGGASLFAVCFLGFTLMTGRPLERVPMVGPLLVSDGEEQPTEPEREAEQRARAWRPRSEVIEAGVGVLHAFELPSPFTQSELQALTDEVKALRLRLASHEEELDRRQRELDDRAESLSEQSEAMLALRAALEDYEHELDLREQEIARGELAVQERRLSSWREIGKVLGSLEPTKAATRLLQYPPAEAAEILDSLEDRRAQAILAAVPDEHWKQYAEAYARLASLRGDRP